jgi:lipopolysaccharide export system protein LptA
MRLSFSMKSPIAIAALSLAAVLAAQAMPAQAAAAPAAAPPPAPPTAATPPGAAPADAGKTPKSPVDITSDHMETHSSDCSATWTGSPEALRDSARLRSDIMITHMEVLKKDKPGAKPAPKPTAPGAAPAAGTGDCGDLISVEAKGNVYYASPDGRRVHGDNGFYDAVTKIMTVTGDVTAVDGQNVMRGTKMIYNTDTGEGHMEGAAQGPGAKNRPRGVFYPKDANTDASATGTAAGTAGAATPPAKPKKKKTAQ